MLTTLFINAGYAAVIAAAFGYGVVGSYIQLLDYVVGLVWLSFMVYVVALLFAVIPTA